MKKFTVSCVAIVLAVQAVAGANAAVIFTADPNATRELIAGGLARYTLSFTAQTAGGVIAGFDGNFAGDNGFNGPMTQILAGGALPTPNQDLNGLIDESGDSQFLVTTAQILSATAPFETANTLGGAFTLQVAARAAVKGLIQIVADANAQVPYDFGVSEVVGATSATTQFAGTLGIPEPTTVGMAALSLLGLVAARRRVA